ncbi:MAG: MaoC family dehydratase [Alphaproteobacteria bacterium]|nr:MAG: MaoC family dehydratase [Alphaproteobacteria bacterium]
MRDAAGKGLVSGLAGRIGEELVCSNWLTVTQDMVNAFADTTRDHQWIHVDVERARRESPFGGPIAHGFLTLSLLPAFLDGAFAGLPIRQIINYGCERVRFPAPVPVGSRLRGRARLKAVEEGPMGSLKCTIAAAVEIEGGDKPACVADQVFLLFPREE